MLRLDLAAKVSSREGYVTTERKLSEVLSEFARTMLTDFPIQAILDHLVERIVDVLPITAAGVTLITPGMSPRYVAASNDSALRYETLQTELGEGPCLVAYHTGEAVVAADLSEDSRFSRFTPRALEAGLAAVFTFPLRHGDKRLGALDLYRDSPGALDTADMASAQTLADVAAAYLLNAKARADLRDSSDRSRKSALHDALTGLPNRSLLIQRLDHAVLRASRSHKTAAVLFADLDGFKEVNDQHGHHIGDDLLVAVAARLTAALRPGDTLARMSGDEFVILCEDLDGPAQVDMLAARIGAAFAAPFLLSGVDVSITASVGIAFSGPGDQLSEDLLKEADTAMYQAKRKGGARYQIVDLRELDLSDQRTSLELDLRGAVARGEMRTEYQPIVDTGDGRITGIEALLRWNHPTRGLLPPRLLIPFAEQSGLIIEIGRWILEQGCSDSQRWQGRPIRDLTISVNVSAHQIMSVDYPATVAAVFADIDTDPTRVTLEMTETAFLQDTARALVVLTELKALGVKLALDDFGTGYSSLNYLQQFPIDIVKIDRSFVAKLGQARKNDAIVAAVIDLAHELDMTVIAEGVETIEQRQQLDTLGCDSCQGYYFARPMTPADLDILLQSHVGNETVLLPELASHR